MVEERDWVRVVHGGTCDECGLDAAAAPRGELPDGLRHAARCWATLLNDTSSARLQARPHGSAWSALEHGSQVERLLEEFGSHLDRLLVEDSPELGRQDHGAAAVPDRPEQPDPERLADAIVGGTGSSSSLLAGLDDDQWSRVGRRGDDERLSIEGLARMAWHDAVHHLHDASMLVAESWTGASVTTAEATRWLHLPPAAPVDVSAFSSNTLFGQPGIYPDGPPMSPASGDPIDDRAAHALLDQLLDPEHASLAHGRFDDGELRERVPDAVVRAALLLLSGGPASPVLEAFLAGTTPVLRLGVGPTGGQGRVLGQERGDGDAGRRVLHERYRAEHPAVVAPSLAHALCHHGELASNVEEATLHGLLGAVHTWLLAGTPSLGGLRSELARRQASLTITLLNARPPGSSVASIRCPDGPGTIPGGNPDLQCPDLWSIPFTSRRAGDCDLFVPRPVRDSLARLAAGNASAVPDRYDEPLGKWLSEHLGRGVWFGEVVRAGAGLALGLLSPRRAPQLPRPPGSSPR